MEEKARAVKGRTAQVAVLAIAVALLLGAGGARAADQYMSDGTKQNASGTWDMVNGGFCGPTAGATTRPECTATFFTSFTTSASCAPASPAVGGTWTTSATTTAYCIDLVNNTSGTCVNVAPGATYNGQVWPAGIQRIWNTNGSASACFLTYRGYDRNKVVCANQGGTYGSIQSLAPSLLTTNSGVCVGKWNFPLASTYNPPPLTIAGTSQASSVGGDQCLRCHRADTQWNVNEVRWVDSVLTQGHKNMARKADTVNVAPSKFPWAGPTDSTFPVTYPTDSSANPFNWANGTINTGWSCSKPGYVTQVTCTGAGGSWTPGTDKTLYWIYDGWFEEPHLPTAIYAAGSSTSGAHAPLMSYSCGRCHTTGWTSDSAIGPSTGQFAKEPEKSFAGVTWDGTTPDTTGKVNLAGGVSGDTNKYSSWDLFGITCNRCHGSIANNSGSVPYPAATGYSLHNNNMTATSGSGYCSVAGPTTSAGCTAAGGTWLNTACSDGTSTSQAACVNAGKVWTYAACTANSPTSTVGTLGGVPQAVCTLPTPSSSYSTSGACTAVVGATWTDITTTFGSSGACTGAGYTWDGVSKCFTCYVPDTTKSAVACASANFYPLSTTWTNNYATDADSCIDAGGKWTDTKTQRGMIITALCMGCHRQETGGLPYGATNVTATYGTQVACTGAGKTWIGTLGASAGTVGMCVDNSATDPGQQVKVGPYHNTITFPSHFHGNQYLNGTHGKFTSTFDKIATGKFNFAGTGEYKSHFLGDGEVTNTGNGCTGCHNVHKSTDEQANPAGGAVKECNECHNKNLNLINHPSGPGTPLAQMATDPTAACASCHMPGGWHFFRINPSASYSTFPASAYALASGVVNANTAPDGNMTNAVWVDLAHACGQCHGGGASTNTTTGTIAAASKVLTVADATGFVTGAGVKIVGAASLDGQPVDFVTYVASVSGTTVNLVGATVFGVTNAKVVLNPTANNASWFSSSTIETYAAGIHNDAPSAAFSVSYGADGSSILVDASASKCSGSNANCNAYDWDWGDGTPHGSGVTATHTYTPPPPSHTYVVTLSVTQYGFAPGIATRNVTAYPADAAPTAAGTCSVDYTTWMATCSNTSTDDHAIQLASINWGDGTVVSNITGLGTGPFTHTFVAPGNFNIALYVVDTAGQGNGTTIGSTVSGSFQYYSITGKIFKKGGILGLGAAQILVKNAANVVVRSVSSLADGSYSVLNLKPGAYSLTVSKFGYTFAAAPQASTTVGPNKTNVNVTATGP